jgi:hypothetical protein
VIGIIPLACAVMLFGVFAFGTISEESSSFQKFVRCFYGLTFGDSIFITYGLFSDGSDLYDLLSFLYGTAILILAAYGFFPAFTATITLLFKFEVIPIQEAEARARTEADHGPTDSAVY